MNALLIRHAAIAAHHTLGQRAEESLTAAGKLQAEALAKRVRRWNVAAVFSSPLKRAIETARIIGDDFAIDRALIEVDAGEWEKRTIDELSGVEAWRCFNTFRSGTRIPGGEMMIEVQSRVVAFLERIAREYGDANVAIVSHAEVIRGAVCHYLGVPLDLSLRIRIDPASLTVLKIHEWGAELSALNEGGEWGRPTPDGA